MSNLPDRLRQYHTTKYHHEMFTDKAHLADDEVDLVNFALNKEWTNPKFKLRHFVGDAQITPFSKLRQWILEIKSREEQIERMEYETQKIELDMEIERRNADSTDDPLIKKKFELEILRMDREYVISKRRMNDYYLERQQLVDLTKELLDSPQGKTPDGRSLLEVFDTQEEDEYEKEYWINRLAKQASMDMIFYGRINAGNMDAICMLPSDQQGEVLSLCYNYAGQNQALQQQIQNNVEEQLNLGFRDTQDLVVPMIKKTEIEEEN